MCYQHVYISSLTNFQEISRIHFLRIPPDCLSGKLYNIKTQVKFVVSINEHVLMSSDQLSSLCLRSQ